MGGGWVEGGVMTLLLGESTKKKKLKVGGEWVEEWRLYYWERAQKKITEGGRGVSGRVKTLLLGESTKKNHWRWEGSEWKSEDFITGREHKKKSLPVGGGWVEEGETLLPGGSTKNFTASAMGVSVREKVWRFWHRQVAPKQKYKNTKQNKDKQTMKAQGEVCIAGLYLQKERRFDSVKHRLKEKASETRKPHKNAKFISARPLLPRKNLNFISARPPLPRKNVQFQSAMTPLPRQKVKLHSAMPPLPHKKVKLHSAMTPLPRKNVVTQRNDPSTPQKCSYTAQSPLYPAKM